MTKSGKTQDTDGKEPTDKNELEYLKMEFDAWKKVVDVQQHFNDLELRIRNFAVTVLGGILGAAALSMREVSNFFVTIWLIVIGLGTWGAFYFMDRWWYHQLLRSAVKHNHGIEERLANKLPGIALGKTISESSGKVSLPILGVIDSTRRLDIFYGSIALLLVVTLLLLLCFWRRSTVEI